MGDEGNGRDGGDGRSGTPAGRTRHRGVLAGACAVVAAVVAAILLAVSCDSGSDGDADGRSGGVRGAASEPRPAGSPTPTPEWDTAPGSLAALGDSVTRGYDACSLLADCPAVSWATGTSPEVDSLAERLDIPTAARWNLARSGALMADLPAQAERAAAHRPELVTVLVGANDACRPSIGEMTPVDEFRADFAEALRTLRRASPDTQVYVAGVPDLERLWSVGRDHPLAPQVWRLGICPSMLADPAAEDPVAVERRAAVAERVRAYNTALREVCAGDPRCRHDGGAVHEYRFTTRELSTWDWFHPGTAGQRVLAGIAHRHVTAERPPA
ncbi:SGNH/GDSL hydrolase family protein [Streptomyces sp. TRM 70361]|uniref:SGNH/GDSL hydrolase family protein n=1 Tax=Streptomyces sp. TRM 70361 TaxID=3116553 RepID=UPI002E7B9E0A|nr:SGNH/GDSL hydrolase family protein [Streptomyces sp. TRM 70361]MEE1939739.1 SGNH/GDSL hydrolase family protein [Streptomyces sp. TRM 70361]